MEPDVTYKHVLSFAFMVEELLRWLVADLHGCTRWSMRWTSPP